MTWENVFHEIIKFNRYTTLLFVVIKFLNNDQNHFVDAMVYLHKAELINTQNLLQNNKHFIWT